MSLPPSIRCRWNLPFRSAQSEVSNAQAQLTNAASTEERQRSLAETRSGSEAAFEEAQLGRRSAIAAVAKAQANLDKAEEQLGYAQLRAEFDGVVTATSAEVGQVVSAGQSIVTIARPDQREAVIDIPDASLDGLKAGSPFEVALQLDPTIRASGVVREIAPEADATTRTRRTKITLVNPPAAFRLGSVVTATATVAAQPLILLPSSAMLMKDGKPNVWLVDAAAGKGLAPPDQDRRGHRRRRHGSRSPRASIPANASSSPAFTNLQTARPSG